MKRARLGYNKVVGTEHWIRCSIIFRGNPGGGASFRRGECDIRLKSIHQFDVHLGNFPKLSRITHLSLGAVDRFALDNKRLDSWLVQLIELFPWIGDGPAFES